MKPSITWAVALIVGVIISIFLVGVAISESTQNPILDKIETYRASPYPASKYLDRETYDYRLKNGLPNPPSFTDALICDLWQLMTADLDIKSINQYRVLQGDVERAIDVYIKRAPKEIAGYRPWTHSQFMRSLSISERKTLATEVVRYMAHYGVRDPLDK